MTPADLTRDIELQGVPASEQMAAFLGVLAEPVEIIETRTRHAGGKTGTQDWHYARDLPRELLRLQRLNRQGHHVYIGVNPRRDFGLAGDVNIACAHVLFVDADPSTGFCGVPDLLDRIRETGLPEPTMVVCSGHGAWVFWRLRHPMTDLTAWRQVQARLIAVLKTDVSCKNPERLTRVPGFINHKDPPALAWLYSVNPDLRYDLEALTGALPSLPPPSPRPAPAAASAESGSLHRRARLYVAAAEGAGEGGRNRTLFNMAGHLAALVDGYGQALSEADIVDLITDYNRRCHPPLDADELRACVRNAMHHGEPRAPKPPRPGNHRQLSLRGREVAYG